MLPNGEVWNGLKRLRKDNTGYDLKQLLIGAEGTLGVVTAAALKLFPILASRAVAFAAVEDPGAAIRLLARAKAESGGAVEAFELISRLGLSLAVKHLPNLLTGMRLACVATRRQSPSRSAPKARSSSEPIASCPSKR